MRDNKRHGHGSYKWESGETYEGGFVDDKRSGQGIMIYKDRSTYDGQWQYD